MKQLYQSKRLWAGVIALITGISIIATGEKTWIDQLPELVLVLVGIVQTVLGLTSNSQIYVGDKSLPEIK